MGNTQYFKVFGKWFAAFYFERMSIHQEVVAAAAWQRWMTQTSVIVMRHREDQLLSHIAELKTRHS